MSGSLRLLPAIAGAAAAPSSTPPKTLQLNFARVEPREGYCALLRFARGLYAAGMPEIVPSLLVRPLILGAVTRTSLNFATGRYTIARDAS